MGQACCTTDGHKKPREMTEDPHISCEQLDTADCSPTTPGALSQLTVTTNPRKDSNAEEARTTYQQSRAQHFQLQPVPETRPRVKSVISGSNKNTPLITLLSKIDELQSPYDPARKFSNFDEFEDLSAIGSDNDVSRQLEMLEDIYNGNTTDDSNPEVMAQLIRKHSIY